jgi:hypothetical protein
MNTPLILYALCLSALICVARHQWRTFRAGGPEGNGKGRTPNLALACVCAGMVLFMSAVPGVMYALLVPDAHPAPMTIDAVGAFP